tara:strand:+ start:1919 stop:2452 length:534 start_codon:yes stop_codon:yes gene_type:complete
MDFILPMRFDSISTMRDKLEKIASKYEGDVSHRIAYNFPLKIAKGSIKKNSLFNFPVLKTHEYCVAYVCDDDLKHEVLHAIYYKNEMYRKMIHKLFIQLSDTNQERVNKTMSELGYDKAFWLDEFQAYMFSEENPIKFFKFKKIDKTESKSILNITHFLNEQYNISQKFKHQDLHRK